MESVLPQLTFPPVANEPANSASARVALQQQHHQHNRRPWLRWVNNPQNTANGVKTFAGHRGAVTNCVFSPDGTLILSASADATLKIWQCDSGREMHTLTGHRQRVNTCAFSPDGRQILSVSDDWSARVWDANTGQQQRVVMSRWRMWLHSFPRLGELLAREVWGGARLGVALWLVLLLMVPVAVLFTAIFDWQALHFKGFSVDLLFHILLVTVGFATVGGVLGVVVGVVEWIRQMNGAVTNCAFSPDGTQIAIGTRGGAVLTGAGEKVSLKLVAWHESYEIKPIPHYGFTLYGEEALPAPILYCAFTPDGKRLLSASRGRGLNNLVVSHIKAHSRLREVFGYLYACWQGYVCGRNGDSPPVSLDPTGLVERARRYEELVAGALFDPFVLLNTTKLADGCLQLIGHRGHVTACTFSQNGETIISATADGEVRGWATVTGEELHTLAAHRPVEITNCICSADGSRIVWATIEGTILSLNLDATPPTIFPLTGHSARVNALAYAPDGDLLASVSDDHTVKLWDLDAQKIVCEFWGNGPLTTVAWAPDGKTLAVGERSGRVLLIQPLGGHNDLATESEYITTDW